MNRILGPFRSGAFSKRATIVFLTAILSLIASMFGACGGSSHMKAPSPILTLSSNAVPFSAVQGSPFNPPDASVNVTNTGAGTLNFTVTSDQRWLTVAPINGTAPETMQIFAATENLAAGTYTGHITVTDPGVPGSPAVVTVTFTVGSRYLARRFHPPRLARRTRRTRHFGRSGGRTRSTAEWSPPPARV